MGDGPPRDQAIPARTTRPRGRLVARGSADNPASRFERIHVVDDPEALEDDARGGLVPSPVRTLYLRDPSRTVLAHNQSPDVGFDTSLNPYRGCEHGCAYCLAPETPLLFADMVWRPLGEVRVGDALVGFDEHPEPGRTRKIRRALVEKVWWSRRPTLRLITRHAEVVTTAEHRWLQAGQHRWSRTEQLAPGRRLRHMPVAADEPFDHDYRVGYVAGMTLGDDVFVCEPGSLSDSRRFQSDRAPFERFRAFLAELGVGSLAILRDLMANEPDSRGYRRGFLAGFFDAEGHDGTSLRLGRTDRRVLERVRACARRLGFEMRMEPRDAHAASLRLVGSIADRIRFFATCRPALERKVARLFGRQLSIDPEPIEAIEPGRPADVVDIQTSTGTFYAAGLATHNCYARPTHEYLGLSAGLDFETRILVKPDAPALLRKALAAPRWRPEVIAMSGVTDPYQPVERRLRITRGCLEVMAEFRNPVAIVTKSALVARDVDLLSELAAHRAAAVNVSVTTLDDALRRALEPRAPSPRRRLAAVETLAEAGVPVGVMVAPVIPALNDAEIPAIVEAAARAGARSAHLVMLRLPYAVAPLFERWLARHAPQRRERVLNRVREMRGGLLNDPCFGSRMRGSGSYAGQVHDLFELACRRAGLTREGAPLSTAAFRRPPDPQLSLF